MPVARQFGHQLAQGHVARGDDAVEPGGRIVMARFAPGARAIRHDAVAGAHQHGAGRARTCTCLQLHRVFLHGQARQHAIGAGETAHREARAQRLHARFARVDEKRPAPRVGLRGDGQLAMQQGQQPLLAIEAQPDGRARIQAQQAAVRQAHGQALPRARAVVGARIDGVPGGRAGKADAGQHFQGLAALAAARQAGVEGGAARFRRQARELVADGGEALPRLFVAGIGIAPALQRLQGVRRGAVHLQAHGPGDGLLDGVILQGGGRHWKYTR